jgi:hypothetical protein
MASQRARCSSSKSSHIPRFCIQGLHKHTQRDRSDGINTANIVSGRRPRRPKLDPDYAAHLAIEEDEPPALVHAFGACINERFTAEKRKKPHRDQLPPEPQNHIHELLEEIKHLLS